MTTPGGNVEDTRTIDDLDPLLRMAVDAGLMTLAEALRADDLTSALADDVCAGELTHETAGHIAEAQAVRDALRRGKA